MPQLYEVHLLDRKEIGLNPWKYSGSNLNDNPDYMGSSSRPEYHEAVKISRQLGKLRKVIISYYQPGEINLDELKRLESEWQKLEGHVNSEEYFNLTDRIHPVAITEESRMKISETLKRKGACPYCANTHSNSAKEKRKKSMDGKGWFYDPITLKSRRLKPTDRIPTGWVSGKKPKRLYKPKARSEILHNKREWKIFRNDELVWEGLNLSEWCKNNNLKDLKFCPSGIKIPKEKVFITLGLSEKKTIVEGGIETGLNQTEYSRLKEHSKSHTFSLLKAGGYYVITSYDHWKAIKLPKQKER